jgi:hypothetical protein
MNSHQKLELHNYYKELVQNGTIKTINEALVFKLSYEKAFSFAGVVKPLKDRQELTFEEWTVVKDYVKKNNYYLKNEKKITEKEVLRRYTFGLKTL